MTDQRLSAKAKSDLHKHAVGLDAPYPSAHEQLLRKMYNPEEIAAVITGIGHLNFDIAGKKASKVVYGFSIPKGPRNQNR